MPFYASPSGQRKELALTPSYSHEGAWQALIGNLDSINDGLDNTATTYGQVGGTTHVTGDFIMDIGRDIIGTYSAIQWKVGLQNSVNSHSFWALEIESLQSGEWASVWGIHRQASDSIDLILSREVIAQFNWRRLRFRLKDTGSYSPRIKIYYVRVSQFLLS